MTDGGSDSLPLSLAVYGTLRRGERNHHLLEDAAFLGPATVLGSIFDVPRTPYRPYAYPALLAAPAGPVQVEIYEVADRDMLARLDELERFDPADEAGSQFVRRRMPVVDGPIAETAVYVYNGPLDELGERIADGDWIRWQLGRT